MKFKFNTCPYCSGTRTLKAMQSAIVNNTTSTRYKDKEVKCKQCDGTGIEVTTQYD